MFATVKGGQRLGVDVEAQDVAFELGARQIRGKITARSAGDEPFDLTNPSARGGLDRCIR